MICPNCGHENEKTAYECARCPWEFGFSTHSDDTAPDPQAEIAALRAERDALKRERDQFFNEALELSFHIIDISNLAFEGLIGLRTDTKALLQAIADLADAALQSSEPGA
jgi:hypothetical protein